MSNILVINASGQETRVALIEQGTISEYYLERKNEKGIVGNIYKGRVVRVLPGMQAAFVDIGLEKAAFLYVADIVSDPNFPGFSEELEEQASATEGDPLEAADLPEPSDDLPPEAQVAAAAGAAEPAGAEAASAQGAPATEGAFSSSPAGEQGTGSPAQGGQQEGAPAPIGSSEPGAAAAGGQPSSTQDPGSSSESSSPAPVPSTDGAGQSAPAAASSGPAGQTIAALAAPPHRGHEGDILELAADQAIDDEEEDEGEEGEEGEGEEGDDDDEDLDEGDAAHAAAEEALAAEEAALTGKPGTPESTPAAPGQGPAALASGATAAPVEGASTADAAAAAGTPAVPAPGTESGQRGLPPDSQRAAARERRGRRRGGRGRKRGGEGQQPRPQGEGSREKPPAADGVNGEKREGREGGRDGREPRGRGHGGGGHGGGHGGGGNGQEKTRNGGGKRAQIQDLLKEGDEVLVQAVKDPIGTKGARITCHISLPGRHLVFMPTVDHVGISRRIENEKERRRLRDLVDKYRPAGTGFIVRTVAEAEPSEKLTADIKFLLGLWNEVGKKLEAMRAPACIHPDLDLILRSIRDLFSEDVNKVVIDDRAEYERVVSFVEQVAPELKNSVELYSGDEPIFDEYGIEQELVRASNRKVWLKSGGYIIIDQTEALVAIDVNSGRYTGKKSLEETITKINCEAAKEIVYQLRLRNIGGIIILDFIDMDKGANREKVFKTLQEALESDRAKTNVLKISDIGLVEMTRKRVRESVGRLMNVVCPTCDGRGHVKSAVSMAYEIMREAQRAARKWREDQLVVNCHPDVAKLLQGPEREALRLLMMRLNKSIVVRPQPQFHCEQYDLHGKWSRPELQQGQRGGQMRRDEGPRTTGSPGGGSSSAGAGGGGGGGGRGERREGERRGESAREGNREGQGGREGNREAQGGREGNREQGGREGREGQGREGGREGGRGRDRGRDRGNREQGGGSSAGSPAAPSGSPAGSAEARPEPVTAAPAEPKVGD